ncbi:globin-1-like [Apostichopus japonicus]|uniref:globin-1-like n=1 Tax=Stichopus japonicus TaxID=307972 RepID=UPI003AB1CFEF
MGASESKTQDTAQLSEVEKNLIRSSWEQALKNKKVFGVNVFIKLFIQNPSSQDLFEQLRGIPLEDLKTHRKMKAHALRVMASLNTLVEQIDEEEILSEMFNNVARTHVIHKVEKAHYDLLGQVLMEVFSEELGAKFDSATKGAWLKAYVIMENIILDKYAEIDKLATERSESSLKG